MFRNDELIIPDNTVALWYGHVDIEKDKSDQCWRMLDQLEQAYAKRLKNELQQKRYIEVHGRLRQLLSGILNQAPEKLVIEKTAFGKPFLAEHPELAFNLSHSANDYIIGVGKNCRIGVDIEHCNARANFSALVTKCFAEEEIQYWNCLPEDQKKTAFYSIWTRKEAFVKAVGRGLALGLRGCVINPEKPDELLRIPMDCGNPSHWRVFEVVREPGVCSAIVVDEANSQVCQRDILAV
jgi:4'-phosphopantetheinyl transferase